MILAVDPAAPNLIVAIAFLRLAAIDHEIAEEIEMAGAFPDLRVHDDGAIEPDHLVGRGSAGQDANIVMGGDHVAPPGFLDVAFEFDAEGAVIPETVEAAVDFARLKNEPSAFAEGDELIHFGHVHRGFLKSSGRGFSIHRARLRRGGYTGAPRYFTSPSAF